MATGLKCQDNQHSQLNLHIGADALQEACWRQGMQQLQAEYDNPAPSSLIARQGQCGTSCQQQDEPEGSCDNISLCG